MAKKTKKTTKKEVKKVVREPRTFAYGVFDYSGQHYVRSYLPSLHGKDAEKFAKQIEKEFENHEKPHLRVNVRKLNKEWFEYYETERAAEIQRVIDGERPII